MTAISTDRVEKEIFVRAPRSRVWQALTNYQEFGKWFNVELENPFVPGSTSKGRLTHPSHKHKIEIQVQRMEPEHFFSWRWHPYSVEPERDYSVEPTTLVEFVLDETPQGTRIKVTESGFDQIPLDRRDLAFRMHTGGWVSQLENVARYVDAN